MSYCLNPSCQKPDQNSPHSRFCQCCGEKFLLNDRYRALKVIGQGGFGKTFLAVDEALVSRPRCVIKQFFLQGQSRQVTQKAVKLFQEEAKRLESLGQHSQVPELYTYLEQNNQLYIVQEFIEGETLAKELTEQGTFTETKIRNLLADLLPVLKFIHQGKVIHRDIKPDNIIRRKSDQKLVLVDFGAAKEVTQTALQRTGTSIGTPGYAAPEQAHGKAIFVSDIFSLGVTCIYLLTQVEPSHLYDPIENKFVWKHKIINSVSNELIEVLDKMTHALVKQRYQSASEVLQVFHRKKVNTPTTGPTIVIKPKTTATIVQAPFRVPKFVAGLAAIAIGGGGFWGWQMFSPHPTKNPSLPISKTTEPIQPLPVLSSPIPTPSPAAVIKPTPAPIQVQPKSIERKVRVDPVKPVSVPKKTTPTKKTVKISPSRPKISVTSRKNTVKSKPKTPYTVQRKPSSTVSQPKKVKVAAKKSPSTRRASTSELERTIRSNVSRQSKTPIARRNTSSDTRSVPQPWAEKSVPNPASEIENTIRSNQP
jgi:serine/threonine protein kinase